jgi:alpha-D-ribose 1-methylphosphonate 5-triphosphate synthase subunit PhnH
LDFHRGVAQVRARAGTVTLITLALVAATVVYLAVVPPMYKASTEIFLDPRGLQVVGSAARLITDQQLEELNTRLSAEHGIVVQQRARVEEIDRLPPIQPSSPRRSLVLIVALAGLMLGTDFIWLTGPRPAGHHA